MCLHLDVHTPGLCQSNIDLVESKLDRDGSAFAEKFDTNAAWGDLESNRQYESMYLASSLSPSGLHSATSASSPSSQRPRKH